MQIWKFRIIAFKCRQTINLPAGAVVLDVQAQDNEPHLWAMCDEAAALTPRRFTVYGTGDPMPANPGRYVSTFQLYDGRIVLHVFEEQ